MFFFIRKENNTCLFCKLSWEERKIIKNFLSLNKQKHRVFGCIFLFWLSKWWNVQLDFECFFPESEVAENFCRCSSGSQKHIFALITFTNHIFGKIDSLPTKAKIYKNFRYKFYYMNLKVQEKLRKSTYSIIQKF
jgi:hypothetical protein